MSSPTIKDSLEEEPLEPAEPVLARRRARDEKDFRDKSLEQYDMVTLGDEPIHPADILDKCAPDAAKRGRADAFNQVREETEEIVREYFPATVAVPFYRFLEGDPQPLRRLFHLRDTWEALVRFLSAVVLAEAAGVVTVRSPITLRYSEADAPRECKLKDLKSDKMAVRIGLIEGVVKLAATAPLGFRLASCIPQDLPSEMRRLNVVRNGFSHESAKSDRQAEQIIDEAYPVLREVLVDLRDLRDVELFRFEKLRPGKNAGVANVERFVGHSQSRRFADWVFSPGSMQTLPLTGDVGNLHRVLAKLDDGYVDLTPFMYSMEDQTGYRARLLEFKQHKGGRWEMECVADSCTEAFDGQTHEQLLSRFAKLSRDGGDDAPTN